MSHHGMAGQGRAEQGRAGEIYGKAWHGRGRAEAYSVQDRAEVEAVVEKVRGRTGQGQRRDRAGSK